MSTEPFIGEVKTFGFNFAPRGYMLCEGQTISIAEFTALFSLIGTTYGGNGTTTFNLPDLQGRVPIGQGQGPGLPDYTMGESSGSPTVTLSTSNLPAHIHSGFGLTVSIPVSTGGTDTTSPEGAYLADRGAEVYSSVPTPGKLYGQSALSGATSISGSSLPVGIMNPYLVLNYSIAVEGIFPSRN